MVIKYSIDEIIIVIINIGVLFCRLKGKNIYDFISLLILGESIFFLEKYN